MYEANTHVLIIHIQIYTIKYYKMLLSDHR